MDRDGSRRDDRRDTQRRREEDRDQKPRYGRDRTRSPPRFDRRDDRRRERTPPRPSANRDVKPPPTGPRDREPQRNRDPPTGPSSTRRFGDRHSGRDSQDAKASSGFARGKPDIRSRENEATRVQREDEDDEAYMRRIMGFNDFKTTKNTQVPGNDKLYAVYKVKKNEYRQYMNRPGGFNRPLSPSRT